MTTARAGSVALRRVWIGRTTSVIGDRIFAVGAVWIAWSLTQSSLGVACVILAESVPYLIWGAVRRRVRVTARTLVGLDVVRALLLSTLCAVPLTGPAARTFGLLLVVAVGFTTAMFEPAFRSLVPQLAARSPRRAVGRFDLGARLARVVGPLIAAAITWAGSPRLLFAADAMTFGVSALCLYRTAELRVLAEPAPAPRRHTGPQRLPRLSRALVRADGLGTAAVMTWWLALPVVAAQHDRGASTYGLCVGVGAVGGIAVNLALTGSAQRLDPALLCGAGWAATAGCLLVLAVGPTPVLLELTSFVCGAGLAAASVGFGFHAADVKKSEREQLFHRDQVLIRSAGVISAVVGAVAVDRLPSAALVAGAGLLLLVAANVWIASLRPRPTSVSEVFRRRLHSSQ